MSRLKMGAASLPTSPRETISYRMVCLVPAVDGSNFSVIRERTGQEGFTDSNTQRFGGSHSKVRLRPRMGMPATRPDRRFSVPTLWSPCGSKCDGPDRNTSARRRIADIDKSIERLVYAIEAGADPPSIKARLRDLRSERDQIAQELSQVPDRRPLTADEIEAIITAVGGLETVVAEASPEERAEVYRNLGVHLTYKPDDHVVIATADISRGVSRVGGGT